MKLAKRVFRIDNVIKGVPVGSDHCRFNQEPLLKALKDIIQEYTGDSNALIVDPNDQDHAFCPVIVVATEGQDAGGPVKLFRSYGFYKDPCPIWQAARATSAAPSYFPPALVEVLDPGGWYIDGGLRRNNPSEAALNEARKYWKTVRRFCIVSIGTGVQKTVDFIGVSVASGDMDSEDSDGAEDDVPDSEEATSCPSTTRFTIQRRKCNFKCSCKYRNSRVEDAYSKQCDPPIQDPWRYSNDQTIRPRTCEIIDRIRKYTQKNVGTSQ